MKVSELIQKLQALNPNSYIAISVGDGYVREISDITNATKMILNGYTRGWVTGERKESNAYVLAYSEKLRSEREDAPYL